MTAPTLRSALLCLVFAVTALALDATPVTIGQDAPVPELQEGRRARAMQVHYLEIVTPDMDETCSALEKLHDVQFGDPDPALGNARTAALARGGLIGVRAPMRADETPVVRPYLLVDDIESAVRDAEAAGGEIAMPPTEIPGRGRFAIYFLGGIQHGVWQN